MDVDHGYFNNVSTSLLTAFRSAPPRTIAFWELISLSSDDDLELFVHNRFRVQIQFALGCMILILIALIIGFNQISALYVTSWFDC
jgi:hypothetical protein